MDSLNAALANAATSDEKLRLYDQLCEACEVKDNLKYAQPAIILAMDCYAKEQDAEKKKSILKRLSAFEEIVVVYYKDISAFDSVETHTNKRAAHHLAMGDSLGMTFVLLKLSMYYSAAGNVPGALRVCQEFLGFSRKTGYKKGIAMALQRLGSIYKDEGQFKEALIPYLERIQILRKMNDAELPFALVQTAGCYSVLRDTVNALKYFDECLPLFWAQNDVKGVLRVKRDLGTMYSELGSFSVSKKFFDEGLQLALEKKIIEEIADFNANIGSLFFKQGDLKNAEKHMLLSHNIATENGLLPYYLVFNCAELSKVYIHLNDLAKAKEFADCHLQQAIRNKYVATIRDAEHLAARVDSLRGDYRNAYVHYRKFIELRDKISVDELKKLSMQRLFQEEFDKKQADAKAIQLQKDLKAEEEKHVQRIVLISVSSGLLALAFFAIYVFRSLHITRKQKIVIETQKREVEHSKELVDEKNKEIMDSIHCARRIQSSLLPKEKYITKVFQARK